jgi:hypothetical protein
MKPDRSTVGQWCVLVWSRACPCTQQGHEQAGNSLPATPNTAVLSARVVIGWVTVAASAS